MAPIALGDVCALFDFRMLVEPRAAALLAFAAAQDDRSVDPFRELLDRLDDFEKSFRAREQRQQARSLQDFYELSDAFDRAMIAECRNAYLARTISDLRSETSRLRHLAHSGPWRMLTSLGEHRAMLRAITRGDARAAEAACRHHLEQTLQALLTSLSGQDFPGGSDVRPAGVI
ncbi:FCD domain-containing protein [Streptomyces sp. NPDC005355]|uniref:GntR family transcriptional regulator n=1 Tax=Streptomyces sp. NPDC005355 TaxID=3157038 RepID=UPI0033BC3A49